MKRAWPGRIKPSSASAKVVPTVGCPAIGSSTPGVKMRMRTSVPAASGGRTNVVSENAISRAMRCICTGARPGPSGNTANWLPLSGSSVKTS